jgi:hypothetical protein
MASKAYIPAKEYVLEQRINHETPARKTRNNTPAFFTLKKLTPSGPQKKCGYYNGHFQGLYAAGEGNDS